MNLGSVQQLIVEASKQPEGVNFMHISSLYGEIGMGNGRHNPSHSKTWAAINKLMGYGLIQQVGELSYKYVGDENGRRR